MLGGKRPVWVGMIYQELSIRCHPLSTYATFSKKLLFLTPRPPYAYQGVENNSFLENFAYVLNGWPRAIFIDV